MFAEIFYFIKIKESQYTFFWNPESDHSLHRNQPQILPPSPKMYEQINLKQKISNCLKVKIWYTCICFGI